MIDIEPIHISGTLCYSSIYITLSKFYKLPFQATFLYQWHFSYRSSEPSDFIGNRFDEEYYQYDKHIDLYADYCGLHQIEIAGKELHLLYRTVEEELRQNKPCAMLMDTYFCPWNRDYGAYHRKHLVLVIGKNNTEFLCLDPYNDLSVHPFPFKLVEQAMIHFYLFQIKQATLPSGKVLLSRSLEEAHSFIKSKKISAFSEDIMNIDIRQEYANYDKTDYSSLWDVSLNKTLYCIGGSRHLYAMFLQYIDATNGHVKNIVELSNRFHDSAVSWKRIRLNLIRHYLIRKTDLTDIAYSIQSLAYEETSLYEHMASMIQ